MKRWLFVAVAVLLTAGFIGLGVWQIERREWKLALIDRVEQRAHAEPVAAPGPSEWPGLTRENAEYRRVAIRGHFLPGQETLVQAVTARGGGFWVMAPLQTDSGFIVLVNRGFVPFELRDPASRSDPAASGIPVTIEGLIRMTEPGGGFLRANAPAEGRWYSRDVTAISTAQKLVGPVAPYFIDAGAEPGIENEASREPARAPVAGLTVIHFRNSHLSYAITWFTLALMTAGFGVFLARKP